jgi:mannose-1-phosphate guanylyltransferase
MAHVDMAFDVVGVGPDLVILLGIAADCGETEYDWIGPGAPIPGLSPAVAPVRRFWEKPSADVARVLLKSGCLWNSFVMVADITTLLALIAKRRPDLYDALDAVIGAGETAVEREPSVCCTRGWGT